MKYILKTSPLCKSDSVVQGNNYRFTVLTPQMIILEYSEEGIFENRATQTVINRDFETPQFKVIDKDNSLEIITDSVHLIYDKKKFSKNGVIIKVRGNLSTFHSIWSYSEEVNDLKGTARTLDEADGAIPLERALISKNGFSIIDDSKSLLLEQIEHL